MTDGPFHEKISPWVPRMSQNGFKITKQMFVYGVDCVLAAAAAAAGSLFSCSNRGK